MKKKSDNRNTTEEQNSKLEDVPSSLIALSHSEHKAVFAAV